MIRAITATDRDAWAPLFVAYGVFYESVFTDEIVDSTWGRLMDPAAGIDALVAEADGAVVGFAHYRSHPDTFTTATDWYLEDLYVAPEARGAGTATALIARLTEFARETGPGTLRWITADTNERAQRVYDRVATRAAWITYEVKP